MVRNMVFDQTELKTLSLDEIARIGAQHMIKAALQAEIEMYMQSVADLQLIDGRQIVVRNGNHRPHAVTVGSGSVAVMVPRTRNRSGGKENFVSCIIPPYMRRSPKIDEVIPLLYLRGLSTGDIYPALKRLLGDTVSGLSPSNVSRLTGVWEKEYKQWQKRDLSKSHYCYIWVDGIHFNVRFSDNRLCMLVVIGATEDGKKELVAVSSGYRESKESWHFLLSDLKQRGLSDPKLAVGDGALGFWAAVIDTYPGCEWQRCWVHKTANVLDKMPKPVQKQAKPMLHEIYQADTVSVL